ncbi:MAG: STAS domain-containing protein [Pirellulales bacterium]
MKWKEWTDGGEEERDHHETCGGARSERSHLAASRVCGSARQELAIDASDVERVGVQCVQVLIAAARAWETDARAFTFTAVSETFQKTLSLIGVNIDHLLAKESH